VDLRTGLLACVASLALGLAGGAYGCRVYVERNAVQANVEADQHHEQAVTNATQGAAHDQAAEAAKPQVQADAATVARLRAEVARLRKAAAAPASVPPVVPPANPDPVATPLDLAKDELIEALGRENTNLKVLNLELDLRGDSFKSAYEASAREVVALRLAREGQLAAVKGARWAGRLEGFGAGLASTWLKGRLK
jgi:hypothetical protein